MLLGSKTVLRGVEESDLDNWVKWFNDRQTTEFLARVYPYSRSEAEKYWQKSQQTNSEILYSILTQEDKQHIGSISLQRIDWRSRNAELGVLIGEKEYWSKGYGQDAVRTLCRFAFDEMGLKRIYLFLHSANEGGFRAYQKVGFKKEGVARQQLYREGSFQDLILMGLLSDELLP